MEDGQVLLEHRLTVIEGKIEAGFMQTTNALVFLAAKVEAQNGRVASLEKWRWQIVGAALFILAMAPFVFWVLNQIEPVGG